MHEMSLALEVCEIAGRHVPPERLERVTAVGIEIGDDAGIEADNFVFWLEALLTSPPFKAARPVVSRVKGDVLRVSYLEVDDDEPAD